MQGNNNAVHCSALSMSTGRQFCQLNLRLSLCLRFPVASHSFASLPSHHILSFHIYNFSLTNSVFSNVPQCHPSAVLSCRLLCGTHLKEEHSCANKHANVNVLSILWRIHNFHFTFTWRPVRVRAFLELFFLTILFRYVENCVVFAF